MCCLLVPYCLKFVYGSLSLFKNVYKFYIYIIEIFIFCRFLCHILTNIFFYDFTTKTLILVNNILYFYLCQVEIIPWYFDQ